MNTVNKKNKQKRIAIIGCMHGNEIIGKELINELKKIEIKNGSLDFIIAHPKALIKKKRYIDQDLNRSFPGKKDGNTEEKIAYNLKNKLKTFDIVIDIHSTNSEVGSLIVITNLLSNTKKIINKIPIQKVLFIKKNTFPGKSLIESCKLGISLEYGPRTQDKYKTALKDIKILLTNLEMIDGKKNKLKTKTLYKVFDLFNIPRNFKETGNLKEYKQIIKGQNVGKSSKKAIIAHENFYPLFLGKGRYGNTLSLMTTKEKL